jgi:hypothetical protein
MQGDHSILNSYSRTSRARLRLRGRTVDGPFIYPTSRASDELARLFARSASDRGGILDSYVGINLSQRERIAPRSTFQSEE